jgi:hypothetical protein
MTKLDCNIENMTRMVEALESGEYVQAQMRLRTEDGFCCLGVACDVASKAGVGEWARRESEEAGWKFDTPGSIYGETAVLPKAVREWLGVRHSQLALSDWEHGERAIAATTLNDDGKDFAEIAAKIREVYL